MNSKRKRGSASRRDYYLSQQESVLCDLNVEVLEKKQLELKNDLEASYSLRDGLLDNISIDSLFTDLKTVYETVSINDPQSIKTESLKSLELLLVSEESKYRKLKAITKNDLSLELRTGLKSSDDSFARAHSEIEDFSNPYFSIS